MTLRSGTPGTWVDITKRCKDIAIVWSKTLWGKNGRKKAAPVNIIGAVSPVVRAISNISAVNMPLIEFGRTTLQMVCHRVAPIFQQASRKAWGTACKDSLVATITTGKVIMPNVALAAKILVPKLKKSTNAPTPKSA